MFGAPTTNIKIHTWSAIKMSHLSVILIQNSLSSVCRSIWMQFFGIVIFPHLSVPNRHDSQSQVGPQNHLHVGHATSFPPV